MTRSWQLGQWQPLGQAEVDNIHRGETIGDGNSSIDGMMVAKIRRDGRWQSNNAKAFRVGSVDWWWWHHQRGQRYNSSKAVALGCTAQTSSNFPDGHNDSGVNGGGLECYRWKGKHDSGDDITNVGVNGDIRGESWRAPRLGCLMQLPTLRNCMHAHVLPHGNVGSTWGVPWYIYIYMEKFSLAQGRNMCMP